VLDHIVARTVHAARLLEMVCQDHEAEHWEIAIGAAVAPARRVLVESSIIIRADFPAQCWVGSPQQTAELRLHGELQAVRPIVVPDDEVPFSIDWKFDVRVPEVASVRDAR
jgi:hypothetical protein